MTKNEAKKLLPLIQALAEGKDVELFDSLDKTWNVVKDPIFLSGFSYRIKPELVYVPFEWEDWKEFMGKNVINKNGDIWLIIGLSRDEIIIERDEDSKCFKFKDAFLKLNFLDGATFGKLKK
jgi:hypothetical protein